MSTGKRLAKRSILGTRVCARQSEGRYRPGVIQATKTDSEGRENLYCVVFEDKTASEFRSKDLVGAGFQSVTRISLCEDQKVYLTYNGREVTARVLSHNSELDEVHVVIESATNPHVTHSVELKKKLEEIRLLESRKSARLQDQDTDYSRLADGQPEARRNTTSYSIDVPAISGSCRKRRPSADDDVMDDCMAAAMVLMSLSCSPKSPRLPEYGMFSGGESWTSSSSGAHSWSSWQSLAPTTSPPDSPQSSSSSSSGPSDFVNGDTKDSEDGGCSRDEGIDMDEEEEGEGEEDDDNDEDDEETASILTSYPTREAALLTVCEDENKGSKVQNDSKVVFQCTWRGCKLRFDTCNEVERHVRSEHLSDSDLTDHEEEFYYTEVEMEQLVPDNSIQIPTSLDDCFQCSDEPVEEEVSFSSIYTSSAPTLSHLDMVRPPHENPEYKRTPKEPAPKDLFPASPINIPEITATQLWHQRQHQHAYAASAPGIMVSPQKLMRLSPKTVSSSLKGSPQHRKGRSESRKCRKIYGMENRDLWCTQCKWKKACTRFHD